MTAALFFIPYFVIGFCLMLVRALYGYLKRQHPKKWLNGELVAILAFWPLWLAVSLGDSLDPVFKRAWKRLEERAK